MDSHARLHAELTGFLRQHCSVCEQRHLVLLGWMVTGLLLSQTVCFDQWKRSIPLNRCLPASWQRRCRRWLSNSRIDAEALFALNAVILSHDGGDDPHFVYANQAAADLWRMPVSELIGMPSRLSAPPEHQAERASMLKDAAGSGVLTGYAGERIAQDGTRFLIENATLWTVDYQQGPGQAVVFTTWTELP